MTGENACCVLETVINEAGINAGYERREYVTGGQSDNDTEAFERSEKPASLGAGQR